MLIWLAIRITIGLLTTEMPEMYDVDRVISIIRCATIVYYGREKIASYY
jgi:hypothetical protein